MAGRKGLKSSEVLLAVFAQCNRVMAMVLYQSSAYNFYERGLPAIMSHEFSWLCGMLHELRAQLPLSSRHGQFGFLPWQYNKIRYSHRQKKVGYTDTSSLM